MSGILLRFGLALGSREQHGPFLQKDLLLPPFGGNEFLAPSVVVPFGTGRFTPSIPLNNAVSSSYCSTSAIASAAASSEPSKNAQHDGTPSAFIFFPLSQERTKLAEAQKNAEDLKAQFETQFAQEVARAKAKMTQGKQEELREEKRLLEELRGDNDQQKVGAFGEGIHLGDEDENVG